MNYTDNYELIKVEGSDLFNPLTQVNPNFATIDEVMKANEEAGITIATELKSGTVHALTRLKPDVAMLRFVATSNYTLGDSFTVDGVAVTALTPDGQALPSGAYVINQSVLAVLVGSNLTVFLSGAQATDSARLGGELPTYYAKESDLQTVSGVASGAATLANSNLNKINKLSNLNDADIVETLTPYSLSLTTVSGSIRYYKKGSRVNIMASLSSVPINTLTIVGTLPVGYRPFTNLEITGKVNSTNSVSEAIIKSNGEIALYSPTDNTRFFADYDAFN